jgi:hypothetical protein
MNVNLGERGLKPPRGIDIVRADISQVKVKYWKEAPVIA